MLRTEAIALIAEMVRAEVEVVKQVNYRHGGLMKKAAKHERVAVNQLLHALCPLEAPIDDDEFAGMN